MYKLKYNKLPSHWINGLPTGNGRLAAMYWGDGQRDVLSLNHEYLWRGQYRGRESYKAADKLPILRQLLKDRDYYRASIFANTFFTERGGDSGIPAKMDPYQPAGNLVFCHAEETKEASSELCIMRGKTTAIRNGRVELANFCDSNDGLILTRWSCKAPFEGTLCYEREKQADATASTIYKDNEIVFDCEFVCGIKFKVITAIKTNGTATATDKGISVTGATELLCSTNIILAESDNREFVLDFDSLFEAHKEKFSSYMNKVIFELDTEDSNDFTDHRIINIREGKADDKLQELYYHYGRYLMISSCICGKLPPNLQGKWNLELNPPWKCDYHFDINLQMNEWMLEATNMSDFAVPLTDFMLSFMRGGRTAARNLYGCRGICLPLASDVWADCTSESFGYSVWVSAAAWMAQPLWKHYIYTGDKEYLRDKAYKFFKEIALFYEDFLEEDENGIMQIMPSQSPENRFAGIGTVVTVGICTSSGVDVQLAYDGLSYAINSARILGVDAEEADKWEALRDKLPPFAIGSDGRLMEWNEEFEEEQPGHKHLSHLYGLFPSDIFTPEKRRAQYDAAIKSFRYRMAHESGYTGWSRAWISNIYAHIADKDGFYEQITGLLRDFATESLLDIHPDPQAPKINPDIFQIDGNFGMVSAVNEALCGYFDDKVHILRALPDSWNSGRISGIKLPGGHTLSVEWKNGKASKVEVIMGFEHALTLDIEGKDYLAKGNEGEVVSII